VDGLGATTAMARDGFDQDFGLLAPDIDGPDGIGVTPKQGWMC
jgi:hypothetical protein